MTCTEIYRHVWGQTLVIELTLIFGIGAILIAIINKK